MTIEDATSELKKLPCWTLSEDGKCIERKANCGSFLRAIELVNSIANLAEDEQHHPDLHLTGYRNLKVELTTHAIGGLSINDFILATKIESLLAGIGG